MPDFYINDYGDPDRSGAMRHKTKAEADFYRWFGRIGIWRVKLKENQ